MKSHLTTSMIEEWFPRTRAEQLEVVAQLELILASPHFRSSKRSSNLLRFIVDNTLKGQENTLKERTIGVEVFGRTLDYDTNADAIVRIAAGETRKRIAQYYHDSGHLNELRIDLEPGSYIAQFHISPPCDEPQNSTSKDPVVGEVANASPEAPTVEKSSSFQARVPWIFCWRFIPIFALATALVSVFMFGLYARSHRSLIEVAWGNVLSTSSPTLISLGEPNLYLKANAAETQKELSTQQHILGSNAMSYSEVQALVRLVGFMERRKASYRVEAASISTFADLRQGPAVLLCGLDNPWAMRALQSLRFRVGTDEYGFAWILDARNPNDKKWIVNFNQPYSALTQDYAIVARFVDPNTIEPTLIIAGLGENGTKAATEFITDEARLQSLTGDWLRESGEKSFEVVLGTQVINGTSGPPKLLAKATW